MDRDEKSAPRPTGAERIPLLARVALLALPALGEWALERLALLGRAAGYGLLALGEWLGEHYLALLRRAGDGLGRVGERALRGSGAAGAARSRTTGKSIPVPSMAIQPTRSLFWA